MVPNVGKADGGIRLVVGVALFILAALLAPAPLVSLLAALAGVVLIGTALTRRCPLYALLGLDTCPGRHHPQHP